MTKDQYALLVVTAFVSFGLSYAGAAVGLILGHLRLPLFVYVLGSAIGGASTNLAVSGVGALAGSYKHIRDGRTSRHILLLMGLPSVVGAIIAILFFTSVSPFWSHLVIGIMLVQAGWSLIRSRKENPEAQADSGPTQRRIVLEILIGLILGMLGAITGLMLGTLRLPMMIKLLKVDPKVAVGTNMVIGCMTAFTAALTAWLLGGGLDPVAIAIVGPPTVLGSYLGAKRTGHISKEKLKAWVGATVAFSGLFMVLEASQSRVRREKRVKPVPGQPLVQSPDPFMAEDLPDLPIMPREPDPDPDDPDVDPE